MQLIIVNPKKFDEHYSYLKCKKICINVEKIVDLILFINEINYFSKFQFLDIIRYHFVKKLRNSRPYLSI